MKLPFACIVAIAACGPETTSFRTTDETTTKVDTTTVRVFSSGGYISASEEPMTHVGFEITNRGTAPIVFDVDGLRLIALDKHGMTVPTSFVTVTPLGPEQIQIAPGTTTELDAYFRLGLRPRVVDTMRVRWRLRAGDRVITKTTSFTRDDDYPVTEPPSHRVAPSETNARI